MLDRSARRLLSPSLDAIGGRLAEAGVRPLVVTGAGWIAGVGACVAAGFGQWIPALVLWLVNRLLDGLDGPVARRRGATDLGGFLDIVADFSIYAGFVLAVAIAVPDARVAALALLTAYYVSGTAFLALSSLIERRSQYQDSRYQDSSDQDSSDQDSSDQDSSDQDSSDQDSSDQDSIVQDSDRRGGSGRGGSGRGRGDLGDERSLRFVGGLAEGTETVIVYVLFCIFPSHAALIAWVFTAAVAITAAQRTVYGVRILRRPLPGRAAPLPTTAKEP